MLVVKRMSWPNLADLLTEDADAPIGLVGAPLGAGSVTPGGCDQAPARLRATLKRIGRYNVESGRQIGSQMRDYGNVDLAGLSIEQTASALGVSTPTVKRTWAFARGWLREVIESGRD